MTAAAVDGRRVTGPQGDQYATEPSHDRNWKKLKTEDKVQIANIHN